MISHHENRWRKGRFASQSARALTVIALAASLVSATAATAYAEPNTTTTPTTTAQPTTTTLPGVPPETTTESTTPLSTATPSTSSQQVPAQSAAQDKSAAIASTPVTPPPSASVDVEKPEREPGKTTPTGMDLVREQQHALTVPADQLPELPEGAMARTQRAALPGGVSQEDAELAERMAMVANANCQFYFPSPHAVCGEIRNKYNAMGGPASFLGYPTSPEYQNPGNTGARSEFLNGSIYWSAATGAHPITPLFMTKWAQHGWEAGWMRYPTSDEIPNGDNIGSRQEFQTANAAIYWNSAITAPGLAVIGGAIRDKWGQLGWETPGSALGYPISDELVLPGGVGRMNRFERGVIYFHPTTGAHSIRGDILDQWSFLGYEQSQFGYPTAEPVNDGTGWFTQQFQGGQMAGEIRPTPWNLLPVQYLPFDTPEEAWAYFDALAQGDTGGGNAQQGAESLVAPLNAQAGPCTLYPNNIHWRNDSGPGDIVGYKPKTVCSVPVDKIHHDTSLKYEYYTLWRHATGNTSVNYQQKTLEQKNIVFYCNGDVRTLFWGQARGTITYGGKNYYAAVYPPKQRMNCEV